MKRTIYNRKEWIKILGSFYKISPYQKRQINNIWNNETLKPCEIAALANFIKYGLTDIQSRFIKYKKIENHRANTLENYIIKFGKIAGTKLYKTKNEKCKHTKNNFIKRYGKINGIKLYNEHCDKKKETKENFIRRHGKIEGEKRYKEFCNKNRNNTKISKFIELYGEIDGVKRHNDYKQALIFNNTLQGFIKRYGKKNGILKYENRMERMLNASKKGYSNISQECFDKIYNFIKNDIKEIYYKTLNKEKKECGYSLDFCILNNDKKICIEFNGDKFHANPNIYHSEDMPNPFSDKTSKEIWDYDNRRIKILTEHGYNIFVIWESDYKENKEKEILKILDFIYENK